MLEIHCQFCNDIKKFNNRLNNAKRINMRLEQLIKISKINYTLTLTDNRELSRYNCISPVSMMCGHCGKIHKQDLRREEEKIRELCFIIYRTVNQSSEDTTLKRIQREAFDSVRGHYPVLAKLVSENDFIRKEKTDDTI